MGVGKVHGEMESSHKRALDISEYSWQPSEWRPPKPDHRCLKEKQGPQTVESQDLVSPRALSTNPKLARNKSWKTHHWRWIDILIPAWSVSARAIKVQAVHNRNPNENNWEGGCTYFHSSHLPHFSSIFQLQLAFKYFSFLWKVWLAK